MPSCRDPESRRNTQFRGRHSGYARRFRRNDVLAVRLTCPAFFGPDEARVRPVDTWPDRGADPAPLQQIVVGFRHQSRDEGAGLYPAEAALPCVATGPGPGAAVAARDLSCDQGRRKEGRRDDMLHEGTVSAAVFTTFLQRSMNAREAAWWWMLEYNEEPPHDALGELTPVEYRQQLAGSSTFVVST